MLCYSIPSYTICVIACSATMETASVAQLTQIKSDESFMSWATKFSSIPKYKLDWFDTLNTLQKLAVI